MKLFDLVKVKQPGFYEGAKGTAIEKFKGHFEDNMFTYYVTVQFKYFSGEITKTFMESELEVVGNDYNGQSI